MFDEEAIIGDVGVQGADDVVAVPVGVGNLVIEFVSGSLGVTDEVEPVAAPALAVMRAGEESIHQPLVGIGRAIGEERLDRVGRGRQPGEVETESADRGSPAGLGRGSRPTLDNPARMNRSIGFRAPAGSIRRDGRRDPAERLERPEPRPLASVASKSPELAAGAPAAGTSTPQGTPIWTHRVIAAISWSGSFDFGGIWTSSP